MKKLNAEKCRDYRGCKKVTNDLNDELNNEPIIRRKPTWNHKLTTPVKSNADKQREYRMRKKLRASKDTVESATDAVEITDVNHTYIPPLKSVADAEFHKRFTTNLFGVSCSVCD
ncbi:hypothetical protein PGB90_009350 [Kerria lacca]